MRVLIVGAAGSLGRQLAPALAERGHEVVCFDLKRAEGRPYQEYQWVLGDVLVPHALAEAARGCDALVHIPAWHGIHLRHRTRRDFWDLNVDGAFNAFQAALTAGARKLLYCSAMGVYGGIPRPPDRALRITDDSPVVPAKDIYAYTKVIGEQLCELYHRVYGLDVVAFRLGMFVPVDFVHYGLRLVHGGVDERDLAQHFASRWRTTPSTTAPSTSSRRRPSREGTKRRSSPIRWRCCARTTRTRASWIRPRAGAGSTRTGTRSPPTGESRRTRSASTGSPIGRVPLWAGGRSTTSPASYVT
jgi:hypothetical protein